LAKIYISCGDKNQEISLEDAINHHETDKILRDLLFEAIAVKKLLS
jgi:hypothetical protein